MESPRVRIMNLNTWGLPDCLGIARVPPSSRFFGKTYTILRRKKPYFAFLPISCSVQNSSNAVWISRKFSRINDDLVVYAH
jgi:hypothetical protein